MKPNLKVVKAEEPQPRIYGSRAFIAITRNPALVSPKRFEPTRKGRDDVVI